MQTEPISKFTNEKKDKALIFEAVNFWGFWGPAEMRGNDFEENKVVPLIFKQFWIRSNLHLSKLDWLTPQDV